MPDGEEKAYWTQHFGTWINDFDEIGSGADPLDPFSVPEAISVPALNSAGMVLAFLALAGFGAHWSRKLSAGCSVC